MIVYHQLRYIMHAEKLDPNATTKVDRCNQLRNRTKQIISTDKIAQFSTNVSPGKLYDYSFYKPATILESPSRFPSDHLYSLTHALITLYTLCKTIP